MAAIEVNPVISQLSTLTYGQLQKQEAMSLAVEAAQAGSIADVDNYLAMSGLPFGARGAIKATAHLNFANMQGEVADMIGLSGAERQKARRNSQEHGAYARRLASVAERRDPAGFRMFVSTPR